MKESIFLECRWDLMMAQLYHVTVDDDALRPKQ